MNQQFNIQPSVLVSQDSAYEDDNIRVRGHTGTNDLSFDYLQLNNLSKPNKINSENINDLNKPDSERNGEDLLLKKSPSTNPNQSLFNKIFPLKLTKHEIIMIVLNILMFITLILVYFFLQRLSRIRSKDAHEILVMKRGPYFGGPGGISLLDDAEKNELTFQDKITSIKASEILDDNGRVLLSLTFTYSHRKEGYTIGGINPPSPIQKSEPLILNPREYINETIIYGDYRHIFNLYRPEKRTFFIVDIYFKTTRGREILYGSSKGRKQTEAYKNYFLGYVHGKGGGYVDSLRFTWYKYTFNNASITE